MKMNSILEELSLDMESGIYKLTRNTRMKILHLKAKIH